jgi:hypothetical protein
MDVPADPGSAVTSAGTPSGVTSSEQSSAAPVGDDRRLVLSDLVNRVLDRGLVVAGSVTIAVADVDLVRVDLNLVLSAVETALSRSVTDDR